ncbi:MAG: M3 family oligoendopeptidase [Chloroflexi bacterium]|nr:M3 family oligoendopeptidase [Chloroflexota bacterium]
MMTAKKADTLWDLSDLYNDPADPQVEADMAEARQMADDFATKYRGRVASLSADEMLAALRELERIYTLGHKPPSFASLAFSVETQSPELQNLVSRTRVEWTQALNTIVFFDVELKAAKDEEFARLLSDPKLADYYHYLKLLRAFAPHTLSEAEERLFAQMRLTGAAAWSQLYTEIASGLRFPIEIGGETKELTDAEVRALRSSPDRDVRRRAGEVLLGTYERNSHVLTYVFNTLFQDHKLTIGLRKYQEPIEPTAQESELSPTVIETLMATTEANYGIAQDYYRLKAESLGLAGDFRYYDVLAPYTKEESKYDFGQAQSMVLDAFGRFDGGVRGIAERFFAERWIDATPRPGKRGGAFCAGLLPAYHPYVMTNFTGRLEDVFTVAHELGHGIHFYLARKQNVLNFDPTTPMCEIASVFGEILLADYLRQRDSSPEPQRLVLSNMIEDAVATIFRQVMYTRWEQKAHVRRAAGLVPPEEYGSLWMEENGRLYGDAVDFDVLDRWGWVAIPHFVHYRFYCFSYAFAHLVTFALYKKYREDGQGFAPRYVELLASGSKDRPEVLLGAMGLDPYDPGFWQRGFDFLRELLDEFRSVMDVTTGK